MQPILIRLAAVLLVPLAAQAFQPAGKFQTEDQAKKHCPNDVVVWVNLATRLFYVKGHLWYAASKGGMYECRREALEEGNSPG